MSTGDPLALLLRQAARAHLGLKDSGYWPSDVADAQAKALRDAGYGLVTEVKAEADRKVALYAEYHAQVAAMQRQDVLADAALQRARAAVREANEAQEAVYEALRKAAAEIGDE